MTTEAQEAITANELVRQGRAIQHQVIELENGADILVNGIDMAILNVAENSVTVRPENVLVLVLKGTPMYIHKIVDGALVLRPVNRGVSFKRIKPKVDSQRS